MASRGALGACRGTKAPVLPARGLPKGTGPTWPGPSAAMLQMVCRREVAEGPPEHHSLLACVVWLAEGNGAYKAWPERYTRRAETLA